MPKNNNKNFYSQPIEKHDTAAEANIDKMKPLSNVTIPGEIDVKNAKDWVDTNQK